MAAASAANAGSPVLPSGGFVKAGSASIVGSRSGLAIDQTTSKAIIDWSGFSIGQGGSVQFNNGAGATLNRVTGSSASALDGSLTASGSIYLINPNGVIIGKTGVVKTGGGFVASTLDITDANFLGGGSLSFTGGSAASVVNLGKVGALGGDVVLVAMTASNAGSISTPNGTTGLIAGAGVMLRDQAMDGGKFAVLTGGASASATNSGLIEAANVELRAEGGSVYALAGDTAGVIRATGVKAGDGKVWLIAEGGGTTTVAGEITARGPNGSAGFVETSGTHLIIGQARVDTGTGGTWLLDPDDLIIDQTAATTLTNSLGSSNSIYLRTNISGTTGSGDLTIQPGVALGNGGGYLSLTADRDVTIGAGAALNLGSLDIVAFRDILVGDSAQIALTRGSSPGPTWMARRDITFGTSATITESQTNTFSLSADDLRTGAGAVSFGSGASLTTAGSAVIYYNPASNPAGSIVNATSYTNPTDFTSAVSAGQGLKAYMRVNTVYDLQNIQNNLSGNYVLDGNIDATATSAWNGGAGFNSIGTGSNPFTGIFEGNLGSIQHLTINQPTNDYVGLFGSTGSSALLDRFSLTGATIAGRSFVGAITGANAGLLTNVRLDVAQPSHITGLGSFTGGLVGYNMGAVENVGVYGAAISGNYVVGGVVGGNVGTGFVYGSRADNSTISGANLVGGVVGYNSATVTFPGASNSAVSATGVEVGGLIGENAGTLTGGTTGGTVSGPYEVGGAVGVNTGLVTGLTYSSAAPTGRDFVGGLVGVNAGVLRNSTIDGYFTVTGTGSYTGGAVGMNTGTMSGIGVSSIRVAGAWISGGLVGANSAGSITGSSVDNQSGAYSGVTVTGDAFVGGFAGWNNATISSGLSRAAVTTNGTYVGGFVGDNSGAISSSEVLSSTARPVQGSVSGYRLIGGFAGMNEGVGTITSSYTQLSQVQGSIYVGGFVGGNFATIGDSAAVQPTVKATISYGGGFAGYNAGTIANAYASLESVSSAWIAGMFVGGNDGSAHEIYATANAGATGPLAGALVGYNTGSVANAYWSLAGVGTSSVPPTAAGLNAGSISSAQGIDTPTSSSFAGFDFTTHWRANVNTGTGAVGYPTLRYFSN